MVSASLVEMGGAVVSVSTEKAFQMSASCCSAMTLVNDGGTVRSRWVTRDTQVRSKMWFACWAESRRNKALSLDLFSLTVF